ncbi:hypothetical protein GUITHDRAFT_139697 [Guillardia theta CCMP2712]|uniref:WW domain-containing protein n=1 Tax=Guillardia theta (strain CCMP2712) TaxID=905079 RepID=L1J8Q1_GUITC|nr:hypothetical protein GUITHDRAFT_139697 [Guillardia theta CCMP2712]EKX44445.1 hypothetical protein GUITHDRAFT_139697 [Guillardia theta CCMP2712]|eukprot:XP_005831425.1 hypothetical protein GUITHDRAFT_139697 [Guillardia theta CCMP2712]
MAVRDAGHSIEIEVEGQQADPDFIQTPARTDFKPGFSNLYMHTSGDFLQRNTAERRVYRINPWLILFSHEPLSALLTLRPVQIILIVVGVLWIILESITLHGIESSGYFSLIPTKGGPSEFLLQDYLQNSHVACSWELSLQLATRYIAAIAVMVSGFLASWSRFHRTKQVLIFVGLLDGLLNLIIFFQMVSEGYKETAIGGSRHEFIVYAITDLFLFPVPLLFNELYVIEQVFLAHLAMLGSALGGGRVRYESICMMAATALFMVHRELTRSRTLSEAMHSSSVFEKEWEEVKGSQSMFRLTEALRIVRGWGPYGPTFILPSSDSSPTPGESEIDKEIEVSASKSEDAVAIFKGLYPGNILDDYLFSSSHGVVDVATSTIMYSSTPIRSASYKPFFQLILFMVSGAFAFSIASGSWVRTYSILANGEIGARQYRLDVNADPSIALSSPSRSLLHRSFAMTKDSCRRFYPSAVSVSNSSVFYTYDKVTRGNGWQLDLSATLSVLPFNPYNFSLYRLNEGSDLQHIADQDWSMVYSFSCADHAAISFCHSPAGMQDGRTISFDLREPWTENMIFVIFTFQAGFCFLGGVFAVLRKSKIVKFCIASPFHIVGFAELVVALPLSSQSILGNLNLVWGIADLSYGMTLQFKEQYSLHVLPLYVIYTTIFNVCISSSWFQTPFDISYIPFTSYVLGAIWLYFRLKRDYLYRKAVQQVEPDRLKYDACWSRYVSLESCREQLARIKRLCHPEVSSRKVEQKSRRDLMPLRKDLGIFDPLITCYRDPGAWSFLPSRFGGMEYMRIGDVGQGCHINRGAMRIFALLVGAAMADAFAPSLLSAQNPAQIYHSKCLAASAPQARQSMASQTRMSLFQDCGRRVIAGFLGATTFVLPATADAFTAPSYAAQYLISVDTTLPNGWATASTSDGKVYYYNVDTKQTQWEKPTDTVVSFDFNPTIPVDRVTVREQPKLEGGCGETDYRSNSVECGAPAKIPVQDVAEKSISTIEGLAKGDVKQKAQAANERLRMLEAAEMKALSKSELFQKLESRTKAGPKLVFSVLTVVQDPARMAERKKQIDEITQKNDEGSMKAPWASEDDPLPTGEKIKIPAAVTRAADVVVLSGVIGGIYLNRDKIFKIYESLNKLMEDMASPQCGVGLVLREVSGVIEVEEVVPGGAAHRSGQVSVRDVIRSVDSVYVGVKYGKPLEQVRPLIIGQIGTSVRFRISREGREFDCDIVRQPTGYTPLSAAPSPKSSVAPQQLLDVNVKITTAKVEEAVPSASPAPAEVRHSKGIYSVKLQHEAKMPHELTLFPGDIVEVVRKHKTGWWEGVAARSGEKGWFPSHVLCTNLGNVQLNVNDKRGVKDGNISILQDEIEHLKHTVAEQESAMQRLSLRCREFSQLSKDASSVLGEMQDAIRSLKMKKLNRTNSGYASSLQALTIDSSYSTRRSQSDNAISGSEESTQQLKARLDQCENRLARSEDQIAKLEKEKAELEAKLVNSTKAHQEAEHEKKKLKQELDLILSDPELYFAGKSKLQSQGHEEEDVEDFDPEENE